jgi:hypothetical protein
MYGLGVGWRLRNGQRLGSPAQRRMVRYGEIEIEQSDDGSDQSFGLPQREAEHGTQGQRRCDRQCRIVRLTTTRGPWFRTPGCDRLVGEPDRQAPTLAQRCIIFRPIRHPMLLLRNVVAVIGIDLEGHGIHRELRKEGTLPCGTASPDCRQQRPWDLATLTGAKNTLRKEAWLSAIRSMQQSGPGAQTPAESRGWRLAFPDTTDNSTNGCDRIRTDRLALSTDSF